MSFYGTLAAADAYHFTRGNVKWAALSTEKRESSLIIGSDFVDNTYARRAQGVRTEGRAQARAWPRKGIRIEGEELDSDVVPVEVENATYEAAYLSGTGVPLNYDGPPLQGAVTRKKVKGGPAEVETEYATVTQGDRPSFTKIDDIMLPLLSTGGSSGMVSLLRG